MTDDSMTDDSMIDDSTTANRCSPILQCSFAPLLIANANRFVYTSQKDLPVADFAGACRHQYGLHRLIHHGVRQYQFQLRLGNQIHAVLTAAVNLGVPLLPSVAPHLNHRHALDANLVQRGLYGFQLGVLDDCFNLGHDVVLGLRSLRFTPAKGCHTGESVIFPSRIILLPQAKSITNTTPHALTLSSEVAPRKSKLFIASIGICYAIFLSSRASVLCAARDLGEPCEASRSLRRNGRAFGSLPTHFAGPFCPSGGAGGLANFASSTGAFSFTSVN